MSACGLTGWANGVTSMTGNALHHQYQPDSMRVMASARWLDARTLEMTWVFVETAFRDRVACRFEDGGITVERSGKRQHGAAAKAGPNSEAVGWGALQHPTASGTRIRR